MMDNVSSTTFSGSAMRSEFRNAHESGMLLYKYEEVVPDKEPSSDGEPS